MIDSPVVENISLWVLGEQTLLGAGCSILGKQVGLAAQNCCTEGHRKQVTVLAQVNRELRLRQSPGKALNMTKEVRTAPAASNAFQGGQWCLDFGNPLIQSTLA